MNLLLNRYWLVVKGNYYGYGIGVTAYSEEDVFNILEEKMDRNVEVESMTIINSLEDLEQNHVVPNMDEFVSRGIWFPTGLR